MSDNAETMLRGLAAFSRGDWDECLAEVHPEIEWHLSFRMPDLPPDKDVFRGKDEVKMLFDQIAEVWEELTLEAEEILHDDDDLLISQVRFRGRGGVSGIEVDQRFFYLQRLRDGLLVEQIPFESEDAAFAAAGLQR